jgi:hypothetical protein
MAETPDSVMDKNQTPFRRARHIVYMIEAEAMPVDCSRVESELTVILGEQQQSAPASAATSLDTSTWPDGMHAFRACVFGCPQRFHREISVIRSPAGLEEVLVGLWEDSERSLAGGGGPAKFPVVSSASANGLSRRSEPG